MKIRDINPFGLRMEPALREALTAIAEREQRSMNWLICRFLADAVQRDSERQSKAVEQA